MGPRAETTLGLMRCRCRDRPTKAVQNFGTMVKSPNGYPIQSPYIAIANRQAEIMLRIAAEFGFTPASRSRIATPSPAEPSLFDLMEDEPPDDEPAA
jgi:P27 family predicted phage terminase small subunit